MFQHLFEQRSTATQCNKANNKYRQHITYVRNYTVIPTNITQSKRGEKMKINPDLYLWNRIGNKEAIDLLIKYAGSKEKAVKLILGKKVKVMRREYIDMTETNCYIHVRVLTGKYELIDEKTGYCQDGPDAWSVDNEVYRIYAPAIIEHYKEPDRVYRGWEKIIILLPPLK